MNNFKENPLCQYCGSEMNDKGEIKFNRLNGIFKEVSSQGLTLFECPDCGNAQMFNYDQLIRFLRS